jgi:hypothetical protein
MIRLGLPFLRDLEAPFDDVEPVDYGPYTIFTWFRDVFVSVWRAYQVRNYTELKM